MVERFVCNEEVRGPIPLRSTDLGGNGQIFILNHPEQSEGSRPAAGRTYK